MKIMTTIGKVCLTCLPINVGWIICTRTKWSSSIIRSGKL